MCRKWEHKTEFVCLFVCLFMCLCICRSNVYYLSIYKVNLEITLLMTRHLGYHPRWRSGNN